MMNDPRQIYMQENSIQNKPVILACISKQEYKKYIGDSFKAKMHKVIKCLSEYPIFKNISERKL